MTEDELKAAVALICGEQVVFRYYVRTKKGKATSTWVLHQVKKGRVGRWAIKHIDGPTKVKAWEEMEDAALKWADHVVRMREHLRSLKTKKGP